MEKRKNLAVVCLTAAFLLGFLVWSLLKPDDTVSQSERRKLAQKPELTAASVLNGTFMTGFESYTLDPVPRCATVSGRLKARCSAGYAARKG